MGALRPGLLRQDGVCLARVHDLHQHVQRSTAHAEGDRERRRLPRVALQLGSLGAAAAPPGLMHREEAAGGLVVFTTRSALTACLSMSQHSLMNSRCVLASCRAGLWSSFKHLAGYLKLRRMPCKSCLTHHSPGRASSPSASSQSCTRTLIVTALRHSTSVTSMMCVVHGVVLKSSFPELLSAGPTARLLRVPVWWPSQTNRQGDGGALGPHVVERLQLLL